MAATILIGVPAYVWTILALVAELAGGGFFPGPLAPVDDATATLIAWVVAVVPLLIPAALSPAIATLVRRGLAGHFAGRVVLLVRLHVDRRRAHRRRDLRHDLSHPAGHGGPGCMDRSRGRAAEPRRGWASWPLLAILAGVPLGALGARHDPTYRVLRRIADPIEQAGGKLACAMLPLVLAFGITLGVRFGASLELSHDLTMAVYTGAFLAEPIVCAVREGAILEIAGGAHAGTESLARPVLDQTPRPLARGPQPCERPEPLETHQTLRSHAIHR